MKSSHAVQLAVWLLAFYRSVIPILWVSVSYITLLLRRNQDIKPPDIDSKTIMISGDNMICLV